MSCSSATARATSRSRSTTPSEADGREHCSDRLHHGAAGGLTLAAYMDRIDVLAESADERGQAILEALVDYGEQIAPPLD